MMPEAPPRQRSPTSVPRPVAATEDSPIPSPATAAHTGTAHARAGRRDEGHVGDRDGQQARRHHALREKTPLQTGRTEPIPR